VGEGGYHVERNEDLQTELLLREIHKLENRDLQLWYANALVGLTVAAGFLVLALPSVMWDSGPLRLEGGYLPQFFFGLIPLIILFNAYVIEQRRTLRRAREVVTRQLLRAETAETLSLIDPLTEVFNRRYLDRIIPKEAGRSDRQGTPLAFLMIDVDGFKSVNTRFGHVVGDQVLREVAALQKKTLRVSDTLVRYGGDEFLAVLPDTNEEQAKQALERLGKAVERWNRNSPIRGYQMSLSCGVAAYSKGASVEEIVKTADERMYLDKGRQRRAG
jgi:diguanylate cyclase (GGDEF)-like protein